MGRLRNKPQNEQENSPELNDMEASDLSAIEFRIMNRRMFNSMKEDIESIKKGRQKYRV